MVPIQYRDSETEEILEVGYAEATPEIGERVRIGFGEYEVLYRWRCVPTSCVVYVRRAEERVRAAA